MTSNSETCKRITLRTSLWSNLAPDLLGLIANRLEREDILHLLLVCKSWNSSLFSNPITIPPLNSLPLELIPPKLVTSNLIYPLYHYKNPTYPLLVISAIDVYILSRRNNDECWLVGAEQLSSGKVRLVHPLTRVPINTKSPLGKFPQLLSKFRALRVSTGYRLTFTDEGIEVLPADATGSRRVIYFENRELNKSPNDQVDGSLVVLFRDGTLRKTSGVNVNVPLTDVYSSLPIKPFDDIIRWKDTIVAVDGLGRLYGIDPKTMNVTSILAVTSTIYSSRRLRKLLVEWNDDLYLVIRKESSVRGKTKQPSVSFEVYVLDQPNKMCSYWKKLSTLGDRVLFVGSDDCFFVKCYDLGLKFGNCIIYTRLCFGSGDKRLFKDAPNKCLQMCVYDYIESDNFRLLSSDSALSAAFWPPPRWISESNDGPSSL